jgi:hypothetical protein
MIVEFNYVFSFEDLSFLFCVVKQSFVVNDNIKCFSLSSDDALLIIYTESAIALDQEKL